ncbi:unnamed protein product [Amoebophrya sp. A120]|nr:unnamed protein product [Amoebophrya sp. A120]|eukprot:GSA120T00019037001.1
MLSLSRPSLVRRMFLPYYSKERGPPILRFQTAGKPSKPFFKLVACNQRDPRNGKHIEVLGSYSPKVFTNVKEIRLRFSRVKFWLGVGADMSDSVRDILALSGLIPQPPPPFGRRTKGHYEKLKQVMEQRQLLHDLAIEEYHRSGGGKGLHVV